MFDLENELKQKYNHLIEIDDKLNTSREVIEKLVDYTLKHIEKDRIDNEGKEVYKIVSLHVRLCSPDKPLGSYTRKCVKVWVRDMSRRFYNLLNKRDNYQRSEDYGHKIRLNNGNTYKFDIDIDEF